MNEDFEWMTCNLRIVFFERKFYMNCSFFSRFAVKLAATHREVSRSEPAVSNLRHLCARLQAFENAWVMLLWSQAWRWRGANPKISSFCVLSGT
jgi:hypothetical protein